MVQVVIIGGGLGGPTLALSLLKHGISSAIYELRSKGDETGGNIALAPNAARVLDHIGIFGRLRTQGYNYEELAFENGAGDVLGRLLNGSQKRYNFHALRIHRAILRSELVKACELRGIPIHYNKKFKGVDSETSTGATVEFEDGEKVTAEFVIGCDGIHSRVRNHLQAVQPTFSGLMGVMGKVMEPELECLQQKTKPYLPAMLFGANGSFAIMPSSFDGKEIGYFATRNTDELKKLLTDRFLLAEYKWPKIVTELCTKTEPSTLTSWPFFSVPHLENWKSPLGRVIIVGDAAHAIPPTGGQGAAMAFEDCETLAYTLSRVQDITMLDALADATSVIGDQLSKWQKHRQDRIERVLDFTTKNGTLRKSSPQFYEQAAKEWVIWVAFRFMGPEAGAAWLYSYNAENVLGALV